ncbi:MAG: hypothetical protein VX964_05535 [Verrucomicrobiota bacterium]|nr:hypothetical protein [Verrucomicrobiota bacterium]
MRKGEIVAIIDVGSNSIKLLVIRKNIKNNNLESLYSKTLETRISSGISLNPPKISDDAISAGVQSVRELCNEALCYKPLEIRIVATSAIRDATNGSKFNRQVELATGLNVKILTGEQEAHAIGRGVLCDPQVKTINKFMQIDLGGGSLECIHFRCDSIVQATSLALGAVRITEHFITDPTQPIRREVEKSIQKYVTKLIKNEGLLETPNLGSLIATGGAVKVARAILAARDNTALEEYSPIISLLQIRELKAELISLPLTERIKINSLPATRADILPAALITIEQIMHLMGHKQLIHSEYNLCYGIASDILKEIKYY